MTQATKYNRNGRRVARRMFLDIETLPAYHWNEQRRAAYAARKVPANYKKPEAVQKWMDSKGSKLWQETSLNPLHGRLCCIAYALDDAEPVLLWADTPETERAALEHLAEVIGEHGPRLVAHNGFRFDFPYLRARAMSLGMYGLAVRLKKGKPWASTLVDTYYSWTEGARTPGNMTDLCELLQIEDNDIISGADVYRLWATGDEADRALIGDHCLQDVVKLRQVFSKLLKGGYIEGEK
jgi:hypothetical protein